MSEDIGEQLLLQGQQLREQGKTLEALDFLNRALEAFIREQNYSRFAHALLDRAICWQHLYQFNNNDFAFAVLYKKDAEAMLEIVRAKNIRDELAGVYFISGKAQMLFNEYGQAVDFFSKAVENISANRKAQKGDWKTNLGKALYLDGNKEQGIKEILEGTELIKQNSSDADEYTANVWLSGGYLRLAEVLKQDDKSASDKYLAEAKKIIESNSKQIVRKKQLENFIKTGFSGL